MSLLLITEPPLAPPLPTETVQRPPPGLARGAGYEWAEAPPWVFYAIIVAAVLGGLTWALAAIRSRRRGAR
jgi:hypothetical protein